MVIYNVFVEKTVFALEKM